MRGDAGRLPVLLGWTVAAASRGREMIALLEDRAFALAHRFTSPDNVIDVQIMRLRRKIDHELKLLHTSRGIGYRLGRTEEATSRS